MTLRFLTAIGLTLNLCFAFPYISIKDFTQIDVYPARCKLLKVYISKPFFEVRKVGNTVIFKLKKPVGGKVDKSKLPKYLDVVFVTTCGTETKLFPIKDLPANEFEVYLTNVRIPAKNRPIEEEMGKLLKCYLTECNEFPKEKGRIYGNTIVMEEYLYQNTSNKTECLLEPQFCDEKEGCLGVAIEKRRLEPGEVTRVWIFKRR